MRLAVAGQVDRVVRHEVAVDGRREGQGARCAHRHLVEHRSRRLHQAGGRCVGQPAELVAADAEDVEKSLGDPAGPSDVIDGRRRGALRDRGVEQPGRVGAGQQRGHDAAAGRLAEQGDPAGIAAERRDVVAHPGQCGQHVAQASVGREAPGVVEGADLEESERAEAVVHRDDHDVAEGGQRAAVIQRLARRTQDVGTAVHPHHHGFAVAGFGARRRPDVEGQEVLALRGAEVERDLRVGRLRAHGSDAAGVERFLPRLGRFGGPPAQLPDGGSRVRNRLPGLDDSVIDAADGSTRRVHHGPVAC